MGRELESGNANVELRAYLVTYAFMVTDMAVCSLICGCKG